MIHNSLWNLLKYKRSLPKKNPNFFLFANCKDIIFDNYLKDNKSFNEDSIVVLFNTAQPLRQSEIIAKHPKKWIFFRYLADHSAYGTYFRDLNLLSEFFFEKYFFIPDFFDTKYRRRLLVNNFFIPTIDYLISKNIDLSNLNHFSIFDPDELKIVKLHYEKGKTPSTGFWVYLYLKNLYPNSDFTLVGYTSTINPKYHDPSFEKGYLLSDINNNLCQSLGCFITS